MAKKGKKKGGFLGMLGLEAKKAPTQSEKDVVKRHQELIRGYRYLRDRIDKGCAEYFKTQSTETLEQHVGRPALDLMVRKLEQLRAANIAWAQPSREVKTDHREEIINEQLDRKGNAETFVIEERFTDHSIYRSIHGGDDVCPGVERVIHATVEIKGGQHYRLLSVVQVKGVTLTEDE